MHVLSWLPSHVLNLNGGLGGNMPQHNSHSGGGRHGSVARPIKPFGYAIRGTNRHRNSSVGSPSLICSCVRNLFNYSDRALKPLRLFCWVR